MMITPMMNNVLWTAFRWFDIDRVDAYKFFPPASLLQVTTIVYLNTAVVEVFHEPFHPVNAARH